MEQIAASINKSYEELMEAADNYIAHEDHLVGENEMEGMNTPEDFWEHYEKITGRSLPSNRSGDFFDCSC